MTNLIPQIIVASILERDGRFLIIEEPVGEALCLNQPAGRLEADESHEVGTARVCLEKSGYASQALHLVGTYVHHDQEDGALVLRLVLTGPLIAQACPPPAPSTPRYWLTLAQLVESRERHRSPFVLRGVEDYIRGIRYPLEAAPHLTPLAISKLFGRRLK
jgi:hypothetical protein